MIYLCNIGPNSWEKFAKVRPKTNLPIVYCEYPCPQDHSNVVGYDEGSACWNDLHSLASERELTDQEEFEFFKLWFETRA